MEQILDLPVEQERKLFYADFGTRFVASLLDGILLWIVNFILGFVIISVSFQGIWFSYFLNIAINALYFSFLESSENQATLGKMAMGIKVGNFRGERISFANALGRHFGRYLSTLILFIGFLMAAWDEKKQTLHDKLADTYVYKK